MTNKRTLEHWLSALTRAGYDPVDVKAYTNRGDWNGNHPMNHLDTLFRRKDSPDVVLSSYSCNGMVERSTYATVCWPSAAGRTHRLHGFSVLGSERTERNTRSIEVALEWLALKKAPKVDYDELERRTEAEERPREYEFE